MSPGGVVLLENVRFHKGETKNFPEFAEALAKVSTKIPVIESMLDKCDTILIGGGMIFTFYKAQGHSVGASLIEEDMIPMAKDLLAKAEAKGVEMLLPTDVVVADKFAADAASKTV